MLESLHIQNIVLIDRLVIEFKPGFCTLTGETGAGKSILLDALGLALGVRAEAGLVRKGTDQAIVSATFHVEPPHPITVLLAEQGLESDTTLVLRRILGADGRSRAFINDQPVSIGLLRQVGDLLVEIHGQFDTQGLLDPKTHRFLLDEYATIDTAGLESLWTKWREAQEQLEAARAAAEKARAEEAYLRGALDDLNALEPKSGEEEELATLRRRLMNRDQIVTALSGGNDGIQEAVNLLYTAWRGLEKAGEETTAICEGLGRADAELQEVLAQIQKLSADFDGSEYSLTEIDDRLFALRGQARKHGCTPDELPALCEKLAGQLAAIEREDEIISTLKAEVARAKDAYVAAADQASGQRQEAAARLDKLVAAELPPLKLDKARFVTAVEELSETDWGPAGRDRVRFLVATNPGSEPGPLNKIASGGEMSRFMLALKVVMAAVGAAGTYIFDEVDSGIGGPTAAAVGERLARLAASRQIFVVTHAPQVAARASHHYIVRKDGAEQFNTTVIPLGEARQRQEEIARMLAGAEITDEARAAADRLLNTGT